MKQNIKLTILTPTYNRSQLLPRLFNSLREQTIKEFEWLVIDDGSTDTTEEYMKNLPILDFPVYFYQKENGGKHTAINYAHQYIHGDSVLILDSDDYLIPKAVEIVISDWEKYVNKYSIGVISYEKKGIDGRIFSEKADVPDYYVDDEISFRVNQSVGGDRCEVIRANIFKKYSFPIHKNEKFMSEGWLWNNIAKEYLTVYRKSAIYVCEYLTDGLTKIGRKLRMESPLGMMEACKSFFLDSVCLKIQIKEMLLYCVYGFSSNLSITHWLKNSGRPVRVSIFLPLGWILYRYWKWKYSFTRSGD